MRHGNNVRKFGLEKNARNALMKSLVRNFVLKEAMTTTEAKAKELRPMVEKFVTAGKKNTLTTRRTLLAKLYNDTKITNKIIEVLAVRYMDRKGGYTRITKLPPRKSDGAKLSRIEFI